MRVFVISLKESTDRQTMIRQTLSGIDFEFFDAVNLKKNPKHEVYSFYSPKKTKLFKGYTLTLGELGCFASHIDLWRKSIALDESLLIMEDNTLVSENLLIYLDRISDLTEKYGILKLYNNESGNYKKFEKIDSKYSVISNLSLSLSTSTYSITPRVAQIYLDKLEGFFEPVDNFMCAEWRTGQTVYSIFPYMVTRAQISSTIGQRKIKNKKNFLLKIIPEMYRFYHRTRRYLYNKKNKCNPPEKPQ